MGATFVITLREAFEASLLLGIVYTYLDRIGARRGFGYVTWGGALGLLASLGLGVAVSELSGPLIELGPDLIGLGVIFLAVIVLTWHGWWMRQHALTIKGDVLRRIDQARETQRFWIVGLIAFTGVFREGAETVLFLWGLVTQAAAAGGWGSAIGAVLGVTLAAGLGWAIFRGGRRVSLPRFFTATTLLILLLAAGLFSTGVGRLQGLGWLPLAEPLWNTSGLLSDRGLVGSFLGGLVGYRAQPTALELGAYMLYVVVAGALIFRVRWPAPARRAGLHEPGQSAGGAAEAHRLPIAPGKSTLAK
jgi:high-affinity iron transporter